MRVRACLYMVFRRCIRILLSPVFCLLTLSFPSFAQEFTAQHIGDYGNVTVMQVTGNYDANNPDGTSNQMPRQLIAKEFFRTHTDEYDFIVVFSNFDFEMLEKNVLGFYSHVKNDVHGIGKPIIDNTALYGSNSKLQGMIDMGRITANSSEPSDPRFEITLDTLSHEMLHRWSAYVRFKDGNGNISTALLGEDQSHWSYLLDTKGSLQYGNQWQKNESGSYTSGAAPKYYSPLDLYLMGMIDKSNVPPMLLIENQAIDPTKLPEPGATINGVGRMVSIDDIIAVEGERSPNARNAQKKFKTAFIFITTPDSFTGDELYGIESIRNGFLTRFSVLTDGHGLVQVASTLKENLPVNTGIKPITTAPRVLPPNIDDGVRWLNANQKADGSWTDYTLTTERDTAEAVTTLQNFSDAQQQFQAGLAWLGSSASANTDFKARRLEAIVHTGGDGATLVQDLLSGRNRDGGWGSGRNFISNPVDTALALKALARAGYADQLVIGQAITYLKSVQRIDGGWSGDDMVSAVQPTAAVLTAFNSYRKNFNLENQVAQAIALLAGRQNTDGGFGNSPSTVYDSALAVMALQEAGADKAIINAGLNYLKSLQVENGSWHESPFQTALAVRAVWQATVDPDLSVKVADISFIPEKVTSVPTNAVVNAIIWNQGRTDVAQVKVAIYDGGVSPENKVGEQTVAFPGLSPVTVTFAIPVDDGNEHVFDVVVDPDNVLKESNENNNTAAKALLPEATYEFEVLTADLTVTPNPADIHQDLLISAKITNKGTMTAYGVPVRFFFNEPGAPFEIATMALDIPAGGSVTKEYVWKAGRAFVNLPLTVQVDSLNLFTESSEVNNEVAVPVTINGSIFPNLAVSYKEFVITPNPAKEGSTAHISTIVRNEGFSAAADVTVDFYKGTPQEGTLLGTQIIPFIAAGQATTATIDWTDIDIAGNNIVSIVVDQANRIPESNEEDNFAFITLNILSLPELNISSNSVLLSPGAPKEGERASIEISVQNGGEQDAEDVSILVSEGTNELGTVRIPVVNGNSQATAKIDIGSFHRGVHQLTVTVDKFNKILERNKANNTVVKNILVQNSDLWLSERYFSPNGDGVKDSTQLSFTLDTAATVSVVVENKDNETIRIFSGGELDNTTGTVIDWDGRDDNRLLMPDGMYVIKIRNQQGIALGETSVLLDTNRSTLLQAIESNSLIYNKLLKNLNTVSSWTWLADDTGIVVNVLGGNPEFSPGIYFFSSDGLDAYRLISADMGSIVSFDISPTGKVAAVLSKSSKQPLSTQWTVQNTIVITDIDAINLKQVFSYETKYKTGYQGKVWYAQDQYYVLGQIKWSNNGEKLVYTLSTWKKFAEYYSYQDYRQERYELWSAKENGLSQAKIDSIENPGEYFEVNNIFWSPDDSKIAFSHNGYYNNFIWNCRIIDIANDNNIKIFNRDNGGPYKLLWFNNESLFIEENVHFSKSLYIINLITNTKTKLATNSRFKLYSGPFISPDRTRFAYTTADDSYTRSLRIQSADGINTLAYVLHTDYPIGGIDPPYFDSPTWSPDGRQIAFIEWLVISVTERTNYGPKYVILNVEDKSYRRLDSPFTWVAKERFYEWMNEEQNILYVHNRDTYGYSWTPPSNSTFNYYLFNVATGALYPWLLNQLFDFVQVSPLEHSIAFKTTTSGITDLMAASSSMNLAAELRIIRSNSALLLKGTANDVNFEGYKLEYADVKAPSQWTLVSPPSDIPLVSGTFATWVPPQQGTYMVRLTVWDKAGNKTSLVKNVIWNINSATITNFLKSTDFISPNGDGSKDTVELSYSVLQPAHLEFKIYDEFNKEIRTFLKEYTVKTTDSISWDGRDEAGRPVPDGKYRLDVLNFEFLVEVDNTLPIVISSLSSIFANDVDSLYYVDLSALAYDKKLKNWKVEYGVGDNPQEWLEYRNGKDILAAKDSNNSIISPMTNALIQRYESKSTGNDILWLKGKKLRISAEDFAGNRSVTIPAQLEEKVIVSYWDSLFVPIQSIFPNYASSISGFETLGHKVAVVVTQYWDGQQWHDFSSRTENTNGLIELNWNGLAPSSGSAFAVRAKVLDESGGEYYSNAMQTRDMFYVFTQCSDGELLWVNALLDNFVSLKFQVLSSDDGRYKNWTDFGGYDRSKGEDIPRGSFTGPSPVTLPNYHYQVRMVGTGLDGKITYSTPLNLPDAKCLSGSGTVDNFPLHVKYDEAKDCGQVAPGMVVLEAELPKRITGDVALLSLSYFIQKADGLKLLHSYDLGAERWSSTVLPTADLVEGEYPVKAVLTFLDKGDHYQTKEVSSSAVVKVDRVLPDSHIAYPVGFATKICPVRVSGPGKEWTGIPIEASITDNTSIKYYEISYGIGANPPQWSLATAPIHDGTAVVNKQIIGTGSKNGNIGTWDITGVIPGSYTIKIKAVDGSGNVSCSTTGVSFNPIVGIPLITLDRPVISPNGDGTGDDVKITFQIDKDAVVDVKAFRLTDQLQFDSQPTKILLASKAYTAGSQAVSWNGKNESGVSVPDDRYALATYATDSCGSTAMKWIPVQVDMKLPSTDITFPKSGDPLPPGNILDVRGIATDEHFDSYVLEEGQGENPGTWVPVAGGSSTVSGTTLGVWNTFGREGIWTLRLSASDKAGNKSSTSTIVDLGARKSLIKSFQVSSKVFSPNSDGKVDTAKLNFELTEASQVRIEISDTSGALVENYSFNALAPGLFDYSWSGKNSTDGSAADGIYHVSLFAVSSSDPTVTQLETLTAVLDLKPPTLAIDQPADKSFSNKQDINIMGTITDPNLIAYSLKVAGPSAVVLDTSGTQSRAEYLFGTLTNLTEGQYAISMEAKDAGENSTQYFGTFTVDTTAPTASLDTPKPNELFGASKQVVEVTGAVAEKNLEKIMIRYGAGETPAQWIELLTSDALPETSLLFSWNVGKDDGIADGIYTLSFYAKDKAGQEGEAKSKIIVDNTVPEVLLASLKAGDYVTGPRELHGSVFDVNLDKAGIDIAEGQCETAYRWSTIRGITTSVKDGLLEAWKVLPPDGEYCLRLSAIDKVGNKVEVKTFIKIDTKPPLAPILAAKTENKVDVHLDWTRSSELDAGYIVYRDGQRMNEAILSNLYWTDSNLKDGSYSYTVKTVDLAGNLSEPSNIATVRVDVVGPSSRITTPVGSGRISQIAEIKGTATSSGDFKEYRLSVSKNTSPETWNLIRKSPIPVSSGLLAEWDVMGLSDSPYLIKLEAEDLAGNIATHTISVAVDNTPPARPSIVSFVLTGSDVSLSWDSNVDAAGYLVYRNDQIANATGDVTRNLKSYLISGSSYNDKALPDGKYQFYVVAVDQAGNTSLPSDPPRQVSIDTRPPHATITDPVAGAKFEREIAVKAGSPDNDVAAITFQYRKAGENAWNNFGYPAISNPYMMSFNPEQHGLSYGQYQVQAVATDIGGRIDPLPVLVNLIYTDLTAPDAPDNLQAKVDGTKVMLSWQKNLETDVDGYNIYRTTGSVKTKLNAAVVKNIFEYQDLLISDGSYIYEITAVDSFANESKFSSARTVNIFAPVLIQPKSPISTSAIDITGINAGANVSVVLMNETSAGLSAVATVTADAAGKFSTNAFPLALGLNKITAKALDAIGNTSRVTDPVFVTYGEPPSPPVGLTAYVDGNNATIQWSKNIEENIKGYNIYRDDVKVNVPLNVAEGVVSAFSSFSNLYADLAYDSKSSTFWSSASGSGVLAPTWWKLELPKQELISHIDIDWCGVPYSSLAGKEFLVQAWNGAAWITLLSKSDNTALSNSFDIHPPFATTSLRIYITQTNSTDFYKRVAITEVRLRKEAPVEVLSWQDTGLKDKIYQYKVTAIDHYGFESDPSVVSAVVGDVVPPAAPKPLSAQVVGSDVNLEWPVSSESDGVAGYNIYRYTPQGWLSVSGPMPVIEALFTDRAVKNGTYHYSVVAVDAVGNASEPSGVEVTIAVALPPAPQNFRIASLPEGTKLQLTWESTGGTPVKFNVYRSMVAGGPYQKINESPIASLAYTDSGIADGETYFYVLTAIDLSGNEGVFSAEASGVPEDITAPEKPYISSPTTSNITIYKDNTTIAGFAEPAVNIQLLRNNVTVARGISYGSDVISQTSINFYTTTTSLSPDGNLLSYYDSSTGKLSIMDVTSKAVYLVAQGGSSPLWSPAGNLLAYVNSNSRIVVYNNSFRESTNLTSDLNVVENNPAWSSDGKKIVFISNKGGFQDVYLKDLTTDSLSQVTTGMYASFPNVSPDKGVISYYVGRDLYVLNLQSGSSTVIDGNGRPGTSSWSPDGKSLSFVSTRDGTSQIFIYNTQTQKIEQLTYAIGQKTKPAWSPLGNAIAFTNEEGDLTHSLTISGLDGQSRLLKQKLWAPSSMVWTDSGGLSCVTPYYITAAYVKGSFKFTDVKVEPGDNLFRAIATNNSGKVSEPSDEISVIMDTSDLPDISVSGEDIYLNPAIPKPAMEISAKAIVRNPGQKTIRDITVRIYLWNAVGDLALLKTINILQLAGGAEYVLDFGLPDGTIQGTNTIIVIADPANDISEKLEMNNYAVKEFYVTDKEELIVTTSLDAIEYAANQDVEVIATLFNNGTVKNGIITLWVEDQSGNKVALVGALTTTASYGSNSYTYHWNTGTTFAGAYKVHAIFAGAEGTTEGSTSFTILPDVRIAASPVTDKVGYSANEVVRVSSTIKNISSNYVIPLLKVKIKISDVNGYNLAIEEKNLQNLFPSMGNSVNMIWNTGFTVPGNYQATVEISVADKPVSTNTAYFKINPTVSLTGTVSSTLPTVFSGKSVEAQYTIKNNGNVPMGGIVSVLIVDPETQAVLETSDGTQITLAPDTSGKGTFIFSSDWFPLQPYQLKLHHEDQGVTSTIASSSFIIKDGLPPDASILSPVSSSLYGMSVPVVVVASDDASGVALVEYQIDGGGWRAIPLADAVTGRFATAWRADAKDQPRQIQVRLTDRAGNSTVLSETINFKAEVAPTMPSLLTPINGSDMDTFAPTLIVNNASDANDDDLTHEFEIYGDPELAELFASSPVISEKAGATAWQVPGPLTENASYFWRARAFDGQLYGPWMTTASFRINTINDPPSAPSLAAPADGGTVATVTPVLVVNNASDPDSRNLTYNFTVAMDADFTQVVASAQGVFSDQSSTFWQVPMPLQEDQHYYWRAQADDWLMEGPWMKMAQFSVSTTNDPPSVPIIISPTNDSEFATRALDVVVQNSTDPDSSVLTYFCEMDTIPTFDSLSLIRSGNVQAGEGATICQFNDLRDNSFYYVRVKASDGLIESQWSPVVNFFVNTANDPPAVPVLANPSNGAGVTVFNPVLSVQNVSDLDHDPLSYIFEIYSDAELTTAIANAKIPSEAPPLTSWTVPVMLEENKIHYWRASAFDGELYSDWTTPASFVVNTTDDPPSAPGLDAPAEGTTVATLIPTLSVINAVDMDGQHRTYDFELSNGNGVLYFNNVTEGSNGITSMTVDTALADRTSYQWRCRAYDGNSFGPWMNMASFNTYVHQASIAAGLQIEPEVLSKTNEGNWILARISVPEGYKPSEIDLSTIRLENVVPAEPYPFEIDRDRNGNQALKVKFRRSDVISILPEGDSVLIHVTGNIGTAQFEGADTVRVVH